VGAAALVAAGVALDGLGIVLGVSPHGLSRGLFLGSRGIGGAQSMRWEDVAEIRTDWRHPADFTGLVTTVVGDDGAAITFTTQMGLGAYRTLVAEVARRAPRARRVGLTERLLIESGLAASRAA
jgi:hypothetical protein